MFLNLENKCLWIKEDAIDQVFITGKHINELGYVESEETIINWEEASNYEEYAVKICSNGLTYRIGDYKNFDEAHEQALKIIAQMEK